jgi:3-deoxy-D-manno-octulosonate 8-phosphate phosphatase KdsC-like HAD superfamily phosphatase
MTMDQAPQAGLSADEVRRICGDLSDATVEAIMATGATAADVDAAVAWETRSFELRSEEHGLAGAAAEVRDILAEDEDWNEEAERRG